MSCASVQEVMLKGQPSPRRNRLLNAEQMQTPRSSSLHHIFRQQSPIGNTQHIITTTKNLPSSNSQYIQPCSTRSAVYPLAQQQQQTRRPPLASFNATASTPRGTLSQTQQNVRLKPTPSPKLPTNVKTGIQMSAQNHSEVQLNLQRECESSPIKMVPTKSNSPAKMAVISLTKTNSVINKTSPITQKSVLNAPPPPQSQSSLTPTSHTDDNKISFKAQTSENFNEVPMLRQNIQMLTECLTKANNELERKKNENEDLQRQLCTAQKDSARIKQSVDTLIQKNQELNTHLTQAKQKCLNLENDREQDKIQYEDMQRKLKQNQFSIDELNSINEGLQTDNEKWVYECERLKCMIYEVFSEDSQENASQKEQQQEVCYKNQFQGHDGGGGGGDISSSGDQVVINTVRSQGENEKFQIFKQKLEQELKQSSLQSQLENKVRRKIEQEEKIREQLVQKIEEFQRILDAQNSKEQELREQHSKAHAQTEAKAQQLQQEYGNILRKMQAKYEDEIQILKEKVKGETTLRATVVIEYESALKRVTQEHNTIRLEQERSNIKVKELESALAEKTKELQILKDRRINESFGPIDQNNLKSARAKNQQWIHLENNISNCLSRSSSSSQSDQSYKDQVLACEDEDGFLQQLEDFTKPTNNKPTSGTKRSARQHDNLATNSPELQEFNALSAEFFKNIKLKFDHIEREL